MGGRGEARPGPAPPTLAALLTLLTIVLRGHWVLDERGEPVKDVVARRGGLPVAGRQAGESAGKQGICGQTLEPGPLPCGDPQQPSRALSWEHPPWAPHHRPSRPGPHSGGPSVSSRNSSICSVSVLVSPSWRRMGSCEPGAKSLSTSGDLWARGRWGGCWSEGPGTRQRSRGGKGLTCGCPRW